MPAISSSAWNVVTPNSLYAAMKCRMSDAGVIGYAPRNSGLSASRAAVMNPSATASLPVTLR